MAKEFFRPRPAQRRGGFKLVVDTLYRNAAGEVSSGFTFDRDVLEAFVRRIYEKDFHPMTDIELQMFRAVWDTLDIATDKGFGKRPADDPDHDFYETTPCSPPSRYTGCRTTWPRCCSIRTAF